MVKPIVVERMSKRFDGGNIAVCDVSIAAAAGEITSLLGPSGCGKTTTLRCVAGLETPDAGEIRFGTERIFSSADRLDVPTERRGIGMMFQSYALWPHMSVAENVAFALRLRHLSRPDVEAKVRAALDLVRLADRADAVPGQLSGGQQQRVALARALAYDPEVLLLDEPLANLDAQLREEMRYELIEVQGRTGVTALYVTHDQAEALGLSRRIIVMQQGRVAQEGTPQDVYERPKSRFVAEFVGAGNFIPVEEIAGNVARTAVGSLAFRAGAADTRFLMIRPEDVEIVPEAAGADDNVVAVRVLSRLYQGAEVVLQGEASGGQRLRVHSRRENAVLPGTIVAMRLPAEHLIGLAE